MLLSPGTRFGSYEIVALLGAGGMGEVYRARDTKLGRDVAIKVFPQASSQDKERLARFEREAHLLTSLNHSNIATIHGLEESGQTRFLVMELVEGETLAALYARGPLRIEDALPLFKQIADALEAAHEKGIVHRDLKPTNVMVTSEGVVKVLDFGLAKTYGAPLFGGMSSEAPTRIREATETDVILGTAAYMSPEQSRGKAVDRRTDVWAFGCCLFEALTGARTFDGQTVSDIMAAILEREPDWSALPRRTPPRIREMLERCLRKEPKQRLRDMGDAALELQEAIAVGFARPEGAPAAAATRSMVNPFLALVGLGAVLVAAWSLLRAPDVPTQPTVRSLIRLSEVSSVDGEPIVYRNLPDTTQGDTPSLDMSPDGTRLVYVGVKQGVSRLYLRDLDQPKGTLLPGTEGAFCPFFLQMGNGWLSFPAVISRRSPSPEERL